MKIKNTSILSYFVKKSRKKSTEIKEYEQKTDSSRPPVALLLLSRLSFDSAEERINLDRPNIASDNIAKILPPNRSNNVDKLHLLKNAFRPVGEAAITFDFKKCCTA